MLAASSAPAISVAGPYPFDTLVVHQGGSLVLSPVGTVVGPQLGGPVSCGSMAFTPNSTIIDQFAFFVTLEHELGLLEACRKEMSLPTGLRSFSRVTLGPCFVPGSCAHSGTIQEFKVCPTQAEGDLFLECPPPCPF